jgi:hypothetical protein
MSKARRFRRGTRQTPNFGGIKAQQGEPLSARNQRRLAKKNAEPGKNRAGAEPVKADLANIAGPERTT